tara:strand:- start:817 stop:1887 length:1071 start_codon:yes stop_codon:yes gene_type:complete
MSQNSFKNSSLRFLLIRTDRIGDTILTLPSVTAIRKEYPKAFIAFLSKPYTLPLIKQYSGIDLFLTYDPEGRHKGFRGIVKLIQELKELKFQTAVLFYPKVELAFAIRMAKIHVRIGTRYRWYSFLFTNHVYEHRKECKKHESEYNLGLIENLISGEKITPEYEFKPWIRTKAWEEFHKEIKFNDYAIVHPGSGNSAPNLTKKQYELIVDILVNKTDWIILLTGISKEIKLVNELAKNFSNERIIAKAGSFSLSDFFSIVRNASLLVTSSTGPLHMANSSNTPVLSFFCPAKPHTPTRWGPYDQQNWAITPNLSYPEICNLKKCPHGGCLQKLSESEIREVLSKKRLKNLKISKKK